MDLLFKTKENTKQEYLHDNKEVGLQVLQASNTDCKRNVNVNVNVNVNIYLQFGFTCVGNCNKLYALCVLYLPEYKTRFSSSFCIKQIGDHLKFAY
jgi:hypothetical protein